MILPCVFGHVRLGQLGGAKPALDDNQWAFLNMALHGAILNMLATVVARYFDFRDDSSGDSGGLVSEACGSAAGTGVVFLAVAQTTRGAEDLAAALALNCFFGEF